MQGTRQIIQPRHPAYAGNTATPFSWKTAIHGAMLAAAFFFITAIVFGAI